MAKVYVKGLVISPTKLGYVTKLLKKKNINSALMILKSISNKASLIVTKALNSAVSNNNGDDDMYISEISVGRSYILKRIDIKARGKTGRIKKRRSNLSIIISKKEEENGSKSKS